MGCCNNSAVGTENDEKKEFDPKFKGPIEYSERRCRDVWMIILYVAFWVGLVLAAIYGVKAGDPYRLLNGVDSFGNTCGRDNTGKVSVSADFNGSNHGLNLESQGYLLIFDATKAVSGESLQLCVAACPENGTSLLSLSSDNSVTDASTYCLNDAVDADNVAYNPYTTDSAQYSAHGVDAKGCPTSVTSSIALMNRCLPVGDAAGDLVNGVMDSINAGGVFQDFISDLQTVYPAMLIILGCTILVSIIFVFLMRWFAYVMIWVAYFALTLGSITGVALLWYMYYTKNEDYQADIDANVTGAASAKANVDLFLGLSIAWSILGGLLFILLVYMYSRIALVVALFQEAGKCIGTMPLILFYPMFTLISGTICIAYFLLIGLYLFSAGTLTEDLSKDWISYPTNMNYRYMSLYHLFGFYWSFEFTLAFQECVLAACAATWYFTRDKKDISWPIKGAMWRTIRFSLGSLLFGAMVIAIIKIIRYLLSYFESKMKSLSESSSAASFVLKCVDCCLWCCEKCMKFLNRNAYIEIAIYGKSFCRSAMNAFAILLRNALRVAAINSIGDLVLLICKLIITAIGTVAAFFYFQYSEEISGALGADSNSTLGSADNVQYESLQILVIAIFSYFLANMFIGVYEMMIDTIFICFAEDSERNDGSTSKPYFMSRNLLKFMAKEEKRTQKRTEKELKHQQKKAAAAEEQHAQALGNNIDQNGDGLE